MTMRKPLIFSFIIFLLYRVSSVFIVQTFYVPDEYWQSLEVAHKMAFGFGYLTWEWKLGLRSYLYPFCIAFVYKCLEFFHLDSVYLVILIPKLFQAFLTALSDQYFVLLCNSFGFDNYWAKVYIFTNWFWYYCGSRTITNTFETSLTIIALYYFPWKLFVNLAKGKGKNKSLYNKKTVSEMKNNSMTYLSLSAITCIIRPTAGTIWGPLVLIHLISLPSKKLKSFILNCILPVLFCALTLSITIDFFWYGKIIIPAYNFFIFNVMKNISIFYGAHPFYWYISQGLPAVLGLHILPFVMGFAVLIMELFFKASNLFRKIFAIWIFILVINLVILSSIPHKEFRFLLPIMPLMMLITVKASDFFGTSKTYKFLWTFLLVLGFVVPTVIFGIFHQQGSIQLMSYLSNASVRCLPNCSLLFLMPCHSTPLYSHLHLNVSTRFITCEPPITDNSWDESEYFFNNPIRWLQEYWDDRKPPTHIAFYDILENSVGSFLEKKGFSRKRDFSHTFFPDGNVGKSIVVYEKS